MSSASVVPRDPKMAPIAILLHWEEDQRAEKGSLGRGNVSYDGERREREVTEMRESVRMRECPGSLDT